MIGQMSFVTATTLTSSPDEAVVDLLNQVADQLGDPVPDSSATSMLDVAFLFIASQLTQDIPFILERLRDQLKPGTLLGCTAEGVIGGGQEIENQPAMTLLGANLPGVKTTAFMLQPGSKDWHSMLLDAGKFCQIVDVPQNTRLFVLLSDPFSTPMDDVLHSFNTCFPGIPVVGGMSSGALRPNGNILFVDDQFTSQGAVGIALSGPLSVDVIVSQGCRPIWRAFKVTDAHRNVIYSLEDRSPLAWIQDLIPQLSEEDRRLLQNGLFVGRSIKSRLEGSKPSLDTSRDQDLPEESPSELGQAPSELGQAPTELGRGDFLIRGLTGIDQENGAITISDSVIEGELIQFHLRDALTAQEDLEMLLVPQMFRDPPSGGLLFTCNGRGSRLYDHPNGDISIIQQNLQDTDLAGFFCAGEFGPIGDKNFLHGHTVSLALFRSL